MTTPAKIDTVLTVEVPIEEVGRVLCLTIEVKAVCAACGRPLDTEQQRNAPQFMSDALCQTCHEWLGRRLVGWLGPDPSVAQLDQGGRR